MAASWDASCVVTLGHSDSRWMMVAMFSLSGANVALGLVRLLGCNLLYKDLCVIHSRMIGCSSVG